MSESLIFFFKKKEWTCFETHFFNGSFIDFFKDIPCFVDNFSTKQFHGAACWVAGWGATRYGGRGSQSLLSIGLNLMDIDYCRTHSFYQSHILQNDELCAGLPPTEENSFNSNEVNVISGGKDACQGDFFLNTRIKVILNLIFHMIIWVLVFQFGDTTKIFVQL